VARHTWPISKIDLRKEPWCTVIFMAESILPIIIRGSETAKVDCPERVGRRPTQNRPLRADPRSGLGERARGVKAHSYSREFSHLRRIVQ
jgi:hypothetical protein